IHPHLKEILIKSFKDHDAAPLQQSFFSSLTGAVQYSNATAAGVPVDKPVSASEAEHLLEPLIDYLNKNLETLCQYLSSPMAQEVIRKLWDEVLFITEHAMVPALYGALERDRRVQNRRQASMAARALRLLRDFFHADGQDPGLPLRVLDSRRHADLLALLDAYHRDLPAVRRDYDAAAARGRDKELLLRLVRLRAERQFDLSPADRDEARKWLDAQLTARKKADRK
ncbi:hypothetical protein HK405_000878, partial [Cladochytrium tenue]